MRNTVIVNVYKAIAVTPAGRKLITVKNFNIGSAEERIAFILNSQYGKNAWTYEVEPLKTGTARTAV